MPAPRQPELEGMKPSRWILRARVIEVPWKACGRRDLEALPASNSLEEESLREAEAVISVSSKQGKHSTGLRPALS